MQSSVSAMAPVSNGDAIHTNEEIEARLHAIYGLHRKVMDFRLERSPYDELLERLGDPHLKLPPVIHIAGTNGKGSTLAMLRSMYEAAGHNVHAYTSPHLIQFNERIVLSGQQITDDALLDYLTRVDEARGNLEVTFFEYTTALAFLAMSEMKADLCLLEVGLGGRLDCTNIVQQKELAVITQIDFDHTEILGDKIEKIAAEKAGIIKNAKATIAAPQSFSQVLPVIKEAAVRDGSEFLDTAPEEDPSFTISLVGAHQIDNAKTAIAAVKMLQHKFPVSEKNIQDGLANITWAGRLQNITKQWPDCPENIEIILDVGHNPAAAQAVKTQLEAWDQNDPMYTVLVLGMQANKDLYGYISPLLPHLSDIHTVDLLQAMHPLSATDLANKIKNSCNVEAKPFPTAREAVSAIIKNTNEPTRILIAGSLYLGGDVLRFLQVKQR